MFQYCRERQKHIRNGQTDGILKQINAIQSHIGDDQEYQGEKRSNFAAKSESSPKAIQKRETIVYWTHTHCSSHPQG